MALKDTSLIVQAAPLPTTFKGSPNDFLAAMVQRMRIVSPNGANFIFIGDIQPTTNVGPWLKGGTQWWVWSDTQNTYVPLDVSASVTIPFFIGNSTPATNTPPVWLQTTNNSTDTNPNGFGTPIAWYFWNGTAWQPFDSVPNSGSSASRPANPLNLQTFFDTDINVLIHWERSAWRTVSGSPGDIKAVESTTAAAAIIQNPGWAIWGDSNVLERGRVLIAATQDPGGSPAYAQSPPAGVTPTPQGSINGSNGIPSENNKLQLQNASAVTPPPQTARYFMVKQ